MLYQSRNEGEVCDQLTMCSKKSARSCIFLLFEDPL